MARIVCYPSVPFRAPCRHLDGSIRLGTLADLAVQQGIPLPCEPTAEALEKNFIQERFNSLEDYLKLFQYTIAVMQTPESLERVAYEFAADQFNLGVRYFECRFAPQLLAHGEGSSEKLDVVGVLDYVNRGFKRATEEYNSKDAAIQEGTKSPYKYGIIVCGEWQCAVSCCIVLPYLACSDEVFYGRFQPLLCHFLGHAQT